MYYKLICLFIVLIIHVELNARTVDVIYGSGLGIKSNSILTDQPDGFKIEPNRSLLLQSGQLFLYSPIIQSFVLGFGYYNLTTEGKTFEVAQSEFEGFQSYQVSVESWQLQVFWNFYEKQNSVIERIGLYAGIGLSSNCQLSINRTIDQRSYQLNYNGTAQGAILALSISSYNAPLLIQFDFGYFYYKINKLQNDKSVLLNKKGDRMNLDLSFPFISIGFGFGA